MARIKGRSVQVEISKTEGAAKTISAITKASPPVASSTAHGLSAGAVGYLNDISGMTLLEGQAVRVADPETDAFDMPGLNTTGYPDFNDGELIPITAWASFGNLTSYDQAGGEGIETDVGTMHDEVDQVEYGGLSAQTYTFSGLGEDTPSEAMALLESVAVNQGFAVFRITFAGGAQRIFRGQPSLPTEALSKGEVGTAGFSVAVKGRILKLAAVESEE